MEAGGTAEQVRYNPAVESDTELSPQQQERRPASWSKEWVAFLWRWVVRATLVGVVAGLIVAIVASAAANVNSTWFLITAIIVGGNAGMTVGCIAGVIAEWRRSEIADGEISNGVVTTGCLIIFVSLLLFAPVILAHPVFGR